MSRFRGIDRFFAAYYIANVAIIGSYLLVRLWFLEHSGKKYSRFHGKMDMFEKERQSLSLLVIAVTIKFFRRQSLDAFFADSFFFCKSAIGLMTFYMDYRILVYYLIMYLAIAALFPQPFFKGPARLEYFTPASFAEMVEERTDGSGATWLVTFFAPWAPPCLYLEPVIADLSLKYTTESLRFGKIDVSKWPSIAKKYNISLTGVSNQLPTLIMFENGKEIGRIPHVYSDGRVAAGRFRKNDIVRAFELEERLEASLQPPEKDKKGTGGGSKTKSTTASSNTSSSSKKKKRT